MISLRKSRYKSILTSTTTTGIRFQEIMRRNSSISEILYRVRVHAFTSEVDRNMSPTPYLPEGYEMIKRIDAVNNSRDFRIINTGALTIIGLMLLMLIPVPFTRPDFVNRYLDILLFWGFLSFVLVLYIVLHEAVHGLFIYLFGKQKPRFGIRLPYAYAASGMYFDKRSYLLIALAPVILFGIALLTLNILLPRPWFWFVYIVQMMNLSGSAGDAYLACLTGRMPDDVLVRDGGTDMTFYTKNPTTSFS